MNSFTRYTLIVVKKDLSMNLYNGKKPKVSIGLPVYNGDQFIRKRLESLLSQTFTDLELIISDNASTDSTYEICKEFEKKDKRIKFFRQKKNIGAGANFNFVLQESKGDYFMWAAVDDIILPTFIEKNFQVLEKNPNIVCSVSKIKLFGETTDYLKPKSDDLMIIKLFKKIKTDMGHLNTYPASGPYEKRIKKYLKNLPHNQIFYGMYRTDLIKKSYVRDIFLWVEGCIIFNLLKFGELFVVDEVLMNVYDGGVSRTGMLGATKHTHHSLFTTLFPMYPFTKWCGKNLGFGFIIKNLGFFIKVTCIGEISIVVDLVRKIKNSGSK